MTETNMDIIMYHVILPRTKFEVAREETQAKHESLFTFKASMLSPYKYYCDLNDSYEEVMVTINRSIKEMQQTTRIYFTCDQGVKIYRVTYPGFTVSVYHSDDKLMIRSDARYEDQRKLTAKATEILTRQFASKLADIHQQYFNDIKQAIIINYLQELIENISAHWIDKKTRLTAWLTEETQKKDKLTAQVKQYLEQYRSSTNINFAPCSHKDVLSRGEAIPISNFFLR